MTSEIPEFDGCFVTESSPRCRVKIGETVFTLRAITISEHARIAQESRAVPIARPTVTDQEVAAIAAEIGKTLDELTEAERKKAEELARAQTTEATVDTWRQWQLTVAAALGAYKTFGGEGWSQSAPVTVEAVGNLRDDVLQALFLKHRQFFRSEPVVVVELADGDTVGSHAGHEKLVSTV
jgi:hypothetical protein